MLHHRGGMVDPRRRRRGEFCRYSWNLRVLQAHRRHITFCVLSYLRFWGPLEAKSSIQAEALIQIDTPGAWRRVFDLKCRSCGRGRRCALHYDALASRVSYSAPGPPRVASKHYNRHSLQGP